MDYTIWQLVGDADDEGKFSSDEELPRELRHFIRELPIQDVELLVDGVRYLVRGQN